ncbi:efflux RND transporter periplasmic adaptor subunit [Alloacidobacterium dinghuense]|uniref:Efflux RND transporter periplasmic adaptor subunit n=1 Tax=Alloacidobacterium dinghuense TaxID=2763107 RepID=A0A7G8BKC9_9BACT|nr:efflux RND transporter periplasmic adaptor subunit [Alloacidobacterium dinghuense]QNI32999.1 efflux RND transporter periplasmic adaptor subunit [Alloacidobacterium dinghuense]
MARAGTTTNRTKWIWMGAAVAVALVFYLVHLATRTTLPIRAAEVERSSLKSTTSTNGKVEPASYFEAHAPFPGIVKSIYAHEGDKVTQGKLLLQMDDTDALSKLATAIAALRGAQASYDATMNGGTQEERLSLNGDLTKTQMDRDQAQRDVAALEKLQAQGAASAAEVAAAKDRLTATNNSLALLEKRKSGRYDSADIAHAKAALADAQAGYTAAQEVVNQANVKAPFAGTLYSIPVSKSEYVQSGDKLLQMADLTKMQVRAYFDEPEIAKIREGMPIAIRWDAIPDREWHGHVERVPSTIITYGTRNVGQVLISIDDADGKLLPNTNVTVAVTTSDTPDALNVPRDALHTEQGKSYVYRVINGTLRRTPVTVNALNLSQVEIVSGLHEGDVVALGSTNGQPISEGVAVRIVR